MLPPNDGWWAGNSGLTPCVHSGMLRQTGELCVPVQLVPKIDPLPSIRESSGLLGLQG